MKHNTIDEMVKLLKGFKAGQKVQYWDFGDVWTPIEKPSWDFQSCIYRLVPEYRYINLSVREIISRGDGGVAASVSTFKNADDADAGKSKYFFKRLIIDINALNIQD